MVAELKSEQVGLPPAELGWFLRDKLGIDPLRRQLLDTALAGAEDYNLVEREILRLFQDLHLQDPSFRRADHGGDAHRPKLTIRRMFGQQTGGSGMPSSSSTISRSPSTFSSRSSLKSTPSSGPTRRVYLTEVPESPGEDDDPELIPAGDDPEADPEPDETAQVGLEEILQNEAECFAAELQDAEANGVQGEILAGMEQRFKQAAEALVTMKEARSQLQAIRKDRGYGRPSDGKAAGKGGGQASARKTSGRFPCFDCNMHGHWAGDRECTMPGAGLGRKAGASAKKSKTGAFGRSLEH